MSDKLRAALKEIAESCDHPWASQIAADALLAEQPPDELAKLRGKVFALEKAGDAMDLLLTGSMKPSKCVREAWANAKKL